MKSEEMRRSYEARVTQALEDLVGRVVGYDRVRTTVTADLNFDRVVENSETFDPQTQVARSAQTIEESSTEREPPSGDVSVQNNLPGIAGDLYASTSPTAENNRVEETTNYEISKTVRTMNREAGEVKRLSVAVLVDGTYVTDAEGVKTYQPRSEDEMNRIRDLVRSAIGYDEARGDKIEVVNLQFANVDTGSAERTDLLFGFDRSDLLRAAEIITVAIMIILVVLLVLQPMVGRLLATEGGPSEDDLMETDLLTGRATNPALTGPSANEFQPPAIQEDENLIDMKQVEGKVKASSVRKVEDIVATYPEETVAVLRSWMSQES
jgi:flagellar M-ring protein FliF